LKEDRDPYWGCDPYAAAAITIFITVASSSFPIMVSLMGYILA
jgi:hypothetical protein